MEKWLIGTAAFVLFTLWRSRNQGKQMIKHSIESTMVSITECIQSGKLIKADWIIHIPDAMRTKLYYPLTHEIVHIICTTKETPQLKQFTYRCLGHEEKGRFISGQVEISIDYVNSAVGLDLHYHNIILTIQWTFENGKGWYVSSVEHN